MGDVGSAIVAAYKRHVPPDFAKSVVQVISSAYKTAYRTSSEFEQLMKDRYGVERRIQIEMGLHHLAHRLAGVDARIVSNRTGSAHHVELTFGNILLTVEKVSTKSARLRGTKYQRTLAGWAQQTLFPELRRTQPDDYYYGVIVHTPKTDDKSVPAFVDIVFPSADLLVHFARIELLVASGERQGDVVDLQLRLKRKDQEEERNA